MAREEGSWSRYASLNDTLKCLAQQLQNEREGEREIEGYLCDVSLQGRDDLRQDAVMQQVFVLVNRLLQKERETSKRNLNIRTYKVSGVLVKHFWCSHSW